MGRKCGVSAAQPSTRHYGTRYASEVHQCYVYTCDLYAILKSLSHYVSILDSILSCFYWYKYKMCNKNPPKTRIRTDIKMLFSRTFQDLQRPNSRVLQDSTFFPGLSRTCSIQKHGLHEVKKVHVQNQLSGYLHYSKESEMQYLRLYYCIPILG